MIETNVKLTEKEKLDFTKGYGRLRLFLFSLKIIDFVWFFEGDETRECRVRCIKGDNNKFTLLKNGEPCTDVGWSITINDNGLVDLGWILITYGDLSKGENYVKIKNIKGYTNTTINILFENTNGDAVEISPVEIIAR